MRLKKQRELLKNQQFFYLFLEQVLTQFSYNLLNFSLIVTVFKLTKSNFSVSLLLLCFFIPSIINAPIAGIISDHFHRKKILMITNLVWATLVLGFLVARQDFLLILFLTILIQITDEFFHNANAATIPSVVEEKKLMLANTFFSFTGYACMILGSLTVGLLIRLFSPNAPIILASLLVYLAAFFVSKLNFEQKLVRLPKNKEVLKHVIGEIKNGYQFIRNNRLITYLVTFIVSLNGLLFLMLAISPGFVETVLRVEAADASFIFVLPLGIGLITAGLVINKMGKERRKIEFIQKGILLVGLCLLFLAVMTKSARLAGFTTKKTYNFESVLGVSLPLAAIVGLLGFGGALVFIPANTLFLESIPENFRGRIISTNTLLTYLFSAILTLSSGLLADFLGFFPILLFLSIAGIFLGFFSRKILIEAKILEK